MSRPRASVPPEAILIEDEVWQEAFTRREPASRRSRRLHAVEGGRSADLHAVTEMPPEPVRPAPRRQRPAPVAAPRTSVAKDIPVARESAVPAAWDMPAPRESVIAAAPEATAPASRESTRPASESGIPARRTVTIRGYGAERNLPWPESPHRRPQRLPHERAGFKPDRVALWAVMLGILLVVVALAS